MISLERAAYQKEYRNAEYCGKSTDDKAEIVNPKNGDIFQEIDTGNVYKYNEDASTWALQPQQDGGSEGGGTGYTLPVASNSILGGVKVGEGLSITQDGTLNVTQSQTSMDMPMASETEMGAVKVGSGLMIEDDGTLEATAGLYRDPAAGVAFVGPSESKTIMLQRSYQVLYLGYMYISSTVVNPIATTPIYLNAGQNATDDSSSHLMASFDANGASFSITNNDATIGIFVFYGGFGNIS